MLKYTFDFVNKIDNLNPLEYKYMVSFYVESLFTNIPAFETIEIIMNRVFIDSRDNLVE